MKGLENQSILNPHQAHKISLYELTSSYRPESVLFRDEQITRIESLFKESSHEIYVDFEEDVECLLVQGFSGSGKTTVVTHILDKNPGKFYFASGANNSTAFMLIKSLFNVAGSTMGNAIQKAIEKLRARKKILVVDEVNKLKNSDEIKLFFDALNTIYREVPCSIILVTNKKGFLSYIPDDAKLTFHPERVDFKDYSFNEIFDILKTRVILIRSKFPSFHVNDEDIARVSKHVIDGFDGSIRSALTLMRKCIVAGNFTSDFLKNTCDKLILEEKLEELRMLSQHHKKFLEILRDLGQRTNGEIMEVKFQDIVKQTNYSPGRVSQILKYFEEYHGIIYSKEENKGRAGGRSKIVKFVSQDKLNLVKQALEGSI